MTISTAVMLIIVDQDVDESSELLNTSVYGNANVRIMSPNGLWCLSKKYLTPRVFKKVHKWGNIRELWSMKIKILHVLSIWSQGQGVQVRYTYRESQRTKLVTFAYHDPPLVYMDIDKTVNKDGAEINRDNKSKQMLRSSINNEQPISIFNRAWIWWYRHKIIHHHCRTIECHLCLHRCEERTLSLVSRPKNSFCFRSYTCFSLLFHLFLLLLLLLLVSFSSFISSSSLINSTRRSILITDFVII